MPNINLPIRFSDTPIVDPVAAPAIGQHTHEVLRTILGYDDAHIDSLASKGAFGADRMTAHRKGWQNGRHLARIALCAGVAVVGIGETDYYRHGGSPDAEFKLAPKAIWRLAPMPGIDPRDIDGFSSYSDDRNEASRLAAALGTSRLRTATMQWGGGGGGCCAAVANAAASIVAGLADCVVVFRSLAQGQVWPFSARSTASIPYTARRAYLMPYGVLAPPQRFAMRVRRLYA